MNDTTKDGLATDDIAMDDSAMDSLAMDDSVMKVMSTSFSELSSGVLYSSNSAKVSQLYVQQALVIAEMQLGWRSDIANQCLHHISWNHNTFPGRLLKYKSEESKH